MFVEPQFEFPHSSRMWPIDVPGCYRAYNMNRMCARYFVVFFSFVRSIQFSCPKRACHKKQPSFFSSVCIIWYVCVYAFIPFSGGQSICILRFYNRIGVCIWHNALFIPATPCQLMMIDMRYLPVTHDMHISILPTVGSSASFSL